MREKNHHGEHKINTCEKCNRVFKGEGKYISGRDPVMMVAGDAELL